MQRAEIIDTAIPEPRYQLKGKIFEAGYNSFTDFAKAVDIHRVYLSQVLNGHAFPSPAVISYISHFQSPCGAAPRRLQPCR